MTSKDDYTAEDISAFSYEALTNSKHVTATIWNPNPQNITETLFSILTLNSSNDVEKLLDTVETVSIFMLFLLKI